ncbi:MAG: hypothetical protein SGJ20_20115, partial [Planctomycetota bacterium]|nr:hypothetical protein [Planctomycetota bacterium]
LMLRYELTPAAAAQAAQDWPAASRLHHATDQPTLLVFVHPHCPCSKASLTELNQLVNDISHPVDLQIVFVRPPDTAEDWERTSLWDQAQTIPRAKVVTDQDGREAALFGGTTSGEALLYNAEGQLLFQGGLTASRGHEGDSAGRSELASLIDFGGASKDRLPVFGCALNNHCCSDQDAESP